MTTGKLIISWKEEKKERKYWEEMMIIIERMGEEEPSDSQLTPHHVDDSMRDHLHFWWEVAPSYSLFFSYLSLSLQKIFAATGLFNRFFVLKTSSEPKREIEKEERVTTQCNHSWFDQDVQKE